VLRCSEEACLFKGADVTRDYFSGSRERPIFSKLALRDGDGYCHILMDRAENYKFSWLSNLLERRRLTWFLNADSWAYQAKVDTLVKLDFLAKFTIIISKLAWPRSDFCSAVQNSVPMIVERTV
jgi:hypothetical protein